MTQFLIGLVAFGISHAAPPNDEDLIKQTITNYIEGYYLGDPKRVESALSPEMAKRVVAKTKEGKEVLKNSTAESFIKQAATGEGPKYYPEGKRRLEIKVFEIHGKIATAKAIGQDWTDYIHLARIDGKWLIVNVIWAS